MMTRQSGDQFAFSTGFIPARILRVDVSRPIPAVSPIDPESGKNYKRALSVIALHTQPLGIVDLAIPDAGISAREHAQQIWSMLGKQIRDHLGEDQLAPVSDLGETGIPSPASPTCLRVRDQMLDDGPFVSIVVATHNRPDRLARCLHSLQSLDYPRYEIVVVDNVPSNDETSRLIRGMTYGHSADLHYVREDWPGLSAARNRGLAVATGDVVAFTDDDVVADPNWVSHLAAGFRQAVDVACVTGNILPAEMETPAQSLIEQFGGFSKGYKRRIYDLTEHRPSNPLYPYAAGTFGSGANLAFRTQTLRAIGGFDPALSTGTPARGGEDLAVFLAILTRGDRIVYEPAAIVYHHHHRSYDGLQKQIRGYGVGLAAYLTKLILDDPRRLADIVPRVPFGIWYALGRQSGKNKGKGTQYPPELTRAELLGMAYGPFAYVRSRRRLRGRAVRGGRRGRQNNDQA